MTIFDLRRLRLRSGDEHRERVEIELAPLQFGGQRYVPVPEEVAAELIVNRAVTGTLMQLRFRGRLHGPCQRCLEDAVVERSIAVREYQASNDASEELQSPYLEDDKLDLSSWARDSLVLALPEQILHAPDCKGLCPVCGKDLNVEPHEHEIEQRDPRWAALEELREKL